jgi:hypothetical protein
VIDLVAMPLGLWGMKYLVLTRDPRGDIFSCYGSIGRIRAYKRELKVAKAREFFKRYRMKLKLTTTYNPEANGKND